MSDPPQDKYCHDSSTCDEGWSCIDAYCSEDLDAEEVAMILAVGGGVMLVLALLFGSVMLCCRHKIPKGMPGHISDQ